MRAESCAFVSLLDFLVMVPVMDGVETEGRECQISDESTQTVLKPAGPGPTVLFFVSLVGG